jgi:ABC-2 type transport system permease protein
MNSSRKLTMLVRREVWENRALWIAPVVLAGVLLVSIAFGQFHIGGGDHFWLNPSSSDVQRMDPDASTREKIYAGAIIVLTVVQLFSLGIVVFFYLLDSLISERKDRSILFWKSLPISDTQVVASKLLTGLVVAPAFVLLLCMATDLVAGLVWWIRAGGSGIGLVIPSFDGSAWLQVQAIFLMLVPTTILWYAPLAGYVMLVSAWARKNAFLWAVLPPAAILLIEWLIFGKHPFAEFLGRRFVGHFMLMKLPDGDSSANSLGEIAQHIGRVFVDYEIWVGLLVAALLIAAVIRIRRYRDES